MKEIDDLVQFHFGTLSQKTGLGTSRKECVSGLFLATNFNPWIILMRTLELKHYLPYFRNFVQLSSFNIVCLRFVFESFLQMDFL